MNFQTRKQEKNYFFNILKGIEKSLKKFFTFAFNKLLKISNFQFKVKSHIFIKVNEIITALTSTL